MLDKALEVKLTLAARKAARRALLTASKKPEPVAVGSWVAKNLRVPDGPHEGKLYQASETPYLTEIFECLSDEHPCNRVSVRKSAQLGFTLLLMGWAGAIIAQRGARSMIVMPTINAGRDFVEEKFAPLIEKTRALVTRVLPTKQKSGEGSTTLVKKYPGGSCRITGANSTADLRSKTVQYVAGDEIDEWPLDLGEQGDPMAMVDARQFAFHTTGNYKKLEGSTPTIKGQSRIDASFEAGDQRYYEVPCPHCGHEQALEWERLHYSETYPHRAEYQCIECGALIGHHEKMRMLRAGRWVARNTGPGRHPSFHLNALYSPFTTWDRMVEAYLAAKDDPLKLKTWWNLWKGESFEIKGEAPGWKELKDRADTIRLYELGEVPDEALFLTAGVDVQQNRLEIVVRGWGIGGTSYVIDRIILMGETNGLDVWIELTEVWQRTYHTKSGLERRIEMMAVDAGFRPEMVKKWVRGKEAAPKGMPRAMAVKGESRRTDWVLGGAKKSSFTLRAKDGAAKDKRGAVMLWRVGSFAGKVHFYGQLGLTGPNDAGQFPVGFVHFAAGMSDDVYQQAVAEKLVPVPKRSGLVEYEWRLPAHSRNEVLDCLVYSHAAAEALGINRMSPRDWEALAEERTACAPEKGQLDMLSAVIAPAGKDEEEPRTRFNPASLASLNKDD